MLTQVINGYNSLKIKVINKLGNGEEGISDELDFLDDSLIASKINYLKKISKLIDDEINLGDKKNLGLLVKQKEDITFELIFLASNDIKNIDFCISMIEDDNEFKKCLYSLKHWENGNNQDAKILFDEYFKKNKYIPEHYLISKVYGELLYNIGDYHNAAILFRKAVEKRPEEKEIHLRLKEIYFKIGDKQSMALEDKILKILRWNRYEKHNFL